MSISDLRRGERGIVLSVELPSALRERLRTLNVRPGGAVRVLKVSFFKKTFLLQAMGSRVALSREVAACVRIKKV